MKLRLVLFVVAGLLYAAPSWAQYSEGFDDNSADVTINQQADTAVTDHILSTDFAFNRLGQAANVLVFPDLASGNIAYKLMNRLGNAKIVGPLLMGIDRPFNVLQRNSEMESVVDLIATTVVQAQAKKAQIA